MPVSVDMQASYTQVYFRPYSYPQAGIYNGTAWCYYNKVTR